MHSLKKIVDKVRNSIGFPKSKRSFSQCGEDLLVNYILVLRGIKYPTYLDIGANHPFFLSNTALFYQKGCRGVNIEANPMLMREFERFRKRDINLNIGIGPAQDEMDFYIISDPPLSTFSKTEAEQLAALGNYSIQSIKRIQLTTVDFIIEKYCNGKFPDFLSIDVEGLDYEILCTIDFNKNFPKVICVEAAEYSPVGAGARRNDIIDFLSSKGYYEYANTNLNAIMVKNEFWFI